LDPLSILYIALAISALILSIGITYTLLGIGGTPNS
jgi:preprotein translocase subunit Sec61beta